jgi:integrase
MALSALFVSRAKAGRGDPGKYHDGNNLILRIKPGGRASWIFRYGRAGKQHSLGLGSLKDISLSDAREAAANHRRTLALNGDPLRDKRARRAANLMTFDEAAERCIDDRKAGWKNAKHAAQWLSTLKTYASPLIGELPAADVTTDHVVSILKPIWPTKAETASRVRGRIEMVLDWAKLNKHREGENPARWRGHLALMFPPVSKIKRVKHHVAVPVDELPVAFKELGAAGTMAALAIQFCILTAARPGEVQQAKWDEIDFDGACWQLPPERQKTDKAHRVPLNTQALALLKRMYAKHIEGEALIFPGGWQNDTQISTTTMLRTLRLASGIDDVTVHGTARSTFDDWASERTAHPQKLIDLALGHGPKGKTRKAYRRSDLYEQRKPLMGDWGVFLDGR